MRFTLIAALAATLAACNGPAPRQAESGDRIRVQSPVFMPLQEDAMERGV